jgi:hypothetical protein
VPAFGFPLPFLRFLFHSSSGSGSDLLRRIEWIEPIKKFRIKGLDRFFPHVCSFPFGSHSFNSLYLFALSASVIFFGFSMT